MFKYGRGLKGVVEVRSSVLWSCGGYPIKNVRSRFNSGNKSKIKVNKMGLRF